MHKISLLHIINTLILESISYYDALFTVKEVIFWIKSTAAISVETKINEPLDTVQLSVCETASSAESPDIQNAIIYSKFKGLGSSTTAINMKKERYIVLRLVQSLIVWSSLTTIYIAQ